MKKRGVKPCVHVHKHMTCTLGGSGGMLPQEFLVFRLWTASGAFSGTL